MLLKKKERKKRINRNTHSAYRLCSPLGTPEEERSSSLIQWFQLSGFLKKPDQPSWLQVHEPATKRGADQARRGRRGSSLSLCKARFKWSIFQLRVGRAQIISAPPESWETLSREEQGKSKRAFSCISLKAVLFLLYPSPPTQCSIVYNLRSASFSYYNLLAASWMLYQETL